MRLLWKRGAAETIELDVRCASRGVAETEARHRQDRADNPDAEWIFLRDKDRNWVARRAPREPRRRLRSSARDAILDVFISWP